MLVFRCCILIVTTLIEIVARQTILLLRVQVQEFGTNGFKMGGGDGNENLMPLLLVAATAVVS